MSAVADARLIAFSRPTTGWLLEPLAAPCRATPAQTGFPPSHHALSGTPWHGLGIDGRLVGTGSWSEVSKGSDSWLRCRRSRAPRRTRWRRGPG